MRSAIVVFMKNCVFHQSPQYITSRATAGSLKQSIPSTFAYPRGIILLPPRIDITVDLHAPLAPTTRIRAPRLKEKEIPFKLGGLFPYAYVRFVTSRVGPFGSGAMGASSANSNATGGLY